MKIYILFFVVISMLFVYGANNSNAEDCTYWHDVVGVKDAESTSQIDEKDPVQIMKGIECLLKLKGDKSPGAISGATRNDVSASLPEAAVEVTALYYISYLFYQDLEFTDGVALYQLQKGKLPIYNSKKVVKKAYKSYRKWFKKVKKIGLEEARKKKLDPLKGSGIVWR